MAANTVPPAWIQYAADGLPHVRAIAQTSCPVAIVDGKREPLHVRFTATSEFSNVSCDLPLSAETRSVTLDHRVLPLLTHPPRKIAVIGDTGCRIKGLTVQSCNDPAAWPFPVIAEDVAREKPDLIIHVGDFFYRESACPPLVSGCAGSPHGDTWPAWDADWFTPAAPLFATAPMVLVRGNHEDCKRGGLGWMRYLSPLGPLACSEDEGPYAVQAGGLRLVIFDDSAANDLFGSPEQVSAYRGSLERAAAQATGETWLLLHKPVYGAVEEAGVFTFTNATMMGAAGNGDVLQSFSALLSGHLHTFEAIAPLGRPPQIVNGMSGDRLDDRVKSNLVGKIVLNRKITDAFVDAQFGYGIYEPSGTGKWTIRIKAPDGRLRSMCRLEPGAVRCAASTGP